MKRIVSFVLALVMCLSLCACGGNSNAYNLSSEVFADIQKAYEKIDRIGDDILAAWTLGVYNEKDLRRYEYGRGFSLLCENVSLTRDECLAGLAYCEYIRDNNPIFDYDHYRDYVYIYDDEYYEYLMKSFDSTFSACVLLVVKSYEMNGTMEEIKSLLSSAGEKIKEMSENHSDYEHYKSLKEYYTVANTYFNFCKEPTGTLEMAKTNLNDYKNTATNCYNGLYYFFEE